MTASEALNRSGWQVAALALARWTALLMGWVWLGQQGQRLSWSLASGLTAVVLWWTVRLCLAHWARVQPGWLRSSRSVSVLLGLCTAAGALALSQVSAGTPALMGLLGLATVWGAWCDTLDQQQRNAPRCPRPWTGWPPVVAALATWLSVDPGSADGSVAWTAPAVLLMAAALSGWASPNRRAPVIRRACHARTPAHPLPATAMGCMMGSLWLSNAWCTSAGWSSHTVVGLHLALMAAMPALVRADWVPVRLPPVAQRCLPLAGVAAGGGLLWAGETLAHGVVGMLLLALAWTLPNPRQTSGAIPASASWSRGTPLLGPGMLLAAGHWSPVSGPGAMAWVYGALAAWAVAALVREVIPARRAVRPAARPQH